MANEFVCFLCDGDGTRCNCYKRVRPVPVTRKASVEERIQRNEVIIKDGLFRLRRMMKK